LLSYIIPDQLSSLRAWTLEIFREGPPKKISLGACDQSRPIFRAEANVISDWSQIQDSD